MMRKWMIALCCVPFLMHGQDFTLETQGSKDSDNGAERTELLILPYHPHYHISEVDRMMCPPTMDVVTMRDRVRKAVDREITQAFSDSISVIDLLVPSNTDIDIVEYMYNALEYPYAKMEEPEEEKKRFAIGLPKKKKEEKVFGAYSVRSEGQLDRREVYYDRYMSASVVNEGAIDYLQDLHPFEHLLVITQLEITRDTSTESAGDYLCSLHVQLLDAKGNQVKGYKEVRSLQDVDLEYDRFRSGILEEMAQKVLQELWTKITPLNGVRADNADY